MGVGQAGFPRGWLLIASASSIPKLQPPRGATTDHVAGGTLDTALARRRSDWSVRHNRPRLTSFSSLSLSEIRMLAA